MIPSLSTIPNAFDEGEYFPKPNWSVVAEWVDSHGEADRMDEIWTALARDWLEQIRLALPDGYAIVESDHFLALTHAAAGQADRLLRYGEHSRRTILDTLVSVARDDGYGKHVLLAFADTDSYYDYICDFYPEEGQFGLSDGMFLNEGYGHFVVCMAYAGEIDRTIAHEMNHVLLRHLPLPLWLNEGGTQFMEDVVVDGSYFMVHQQIVKRHREYWNGETIHEFWSGDSFGAPDDGQELSYHLAQVLFRNLMSDFPDQVAGFLNTANYQDAGNAALQEQCATSLGERVKQFLGDGPWEPKQAYHELE